MIILGIILIIVGAVIVALPQLASIHPLGWILVVVGVVLLLIGVVLGTGIDLHDHARALIEYARSSWSTPQRA